MLEGVRLLEETGITGFEERKTAPTSEDFMRLLLAQLQNQDPLSPMDDTEFTAQMAQFSSLEQLSDINKTLLTLAGMQEGLVNSQTLELLGRDVLVPSDAGLRIRGAVPERIFVDVPDEAASLRVTVRDEAGAVVRELIVPPVAGRHEVPFDGLDDNGDLLADGSYTIEVEALDVAGEPVDAAAFVGIKVDSVSFKDGLVVIGSDGRDISFADIEEIRA